MATEKLRNRLKNKGEDVSFHKKSRLEAGFFDD
jgi:hypothetical protein